MGSFLLRLRTWWETADRTQRVVTIFGSALLGFLIVGTLYFASRPSMELLQGGMEPADLGMVNEELQKRGIPTQIDTRGDIYVPSSELAEARAMLAMSGKLPTSGKGEFEALSQIGIMHTPRVELETIRAAAEQSLAQTIESMDGVRSASVHLAIPERTAFVENHEPSSASIKITEDSSQGVTPEEGRAIARLVSNSVPDLSPERVTIVSNSGRFLWDGSTQGDNTASGAASKKLEAELSESNRIQNKIQSALDAALGPKSTVVSVQATLDYDSKSVTNHDIEPSGKPVTVETTDETMAKGATGGGGNGSGFDSNNPARANGAGGDKNGGYKGTQKSEQFSSNETTSTTEVAPGTLTGLSISVIANSNVVKDQSIIKSYIDGFVAGHPNDPKFVANEVVMVPFDTSLDTQAAATASAASSSKRMQQIFSLLPVAALIGVAVMVMKAIGRAAKSQNVLVAALPDGRVMPLSAGGPMSLATAGQQMLASGGPLAQAAGAPMAMSAGGGGGGGGAHHADDNISPAKRRELQFRDTEEDIGPIDLIQERINVPLEQIKRMAEERPATVAMLLKSWMLEERR